MFELHDVQFSRRDAKKEIIYAYILAENKQKLEDVQLHSSTIGYKIGISRIFSLLGSNFLRNSTRSYRRISLGIRLLLLKGDPRI